MPVQMDIWRIDGEPHRISFEQLGQESRLESLLEAHIEIIDPNLMVIGRQVQTPYGHYIDLLAVDDTGALVVLELKRDLTPREVVAQLLDYGAWVGQLRQSDIIDIWAAYAAPRGDDRGFAEAFSAAFGDDPPDDVGRNHRLVVVAAQLDDSTERIIDYLADSNGVPLNAVFFRYLQEGDGEYLCRSWLVSPNRQVRPSRQRSPREPWNERDFYVSLGESTSRSWDDCRKYGFVSAGGGIWYSRTLHQLKPGHRVFTCIPGTGYVGIGEVVQSAVPVSEFEVEIDGQRRPLLDAPLSAPDMGHHHDDPELCEHVVRIRWTCTVPRTEAVWQQGFFVNGNSACRLRHAQTIEAVQRLLGVEE